MHLPGFYAEQTVGPPTRTYRGERVYGIANQRASILPGQLHWSTADVEQDVGMLAVEEEDAGGLAMEQDIGDLAVEDDVGMLTVEDDVGMLTVEEDDDDLVVEQDIGALTVEEEGAGGLAVDEDVGFQSP